MNTALSEAASVLLRPYPSSEIGQMRKLEKAKLLDAIENLEIRLVVACALRKNIWLSDDIRGPSVTRESDISLDLGSLVRAQHLLELDIIGYVSKQKLETFPFPLRKILTELLGLKIRLCDDFGLRMLMQYTEHAVRNDMDEVEVFDVASIPNKRDIRRRWFRMVGVYQSILGLIKVNSIVISGLKLEISWLKEDQTLLPMLYSYAILNGQAERLEPLNKFATAMHSTHPDCITLYEAMSAHV